MKNLLLSAEATYAKNVLRVQKYHQRLARMREAYRAWVVSVITKTKPAFITIEKLHVHGMKKNRHLAKSVSDQGFYDFKMKLLNTCRKMGIKLREVSSFYPSNKTCSCCGHKKSISPCLNGCFVVNSVDVKETET
ncbi:transposase [Paenactinomyces guangxiensis]|uniref:Transposase n=1 Tax=Paenactinomyces guangxiensis TaxID=1490290 RepID=A0A7W1WSM2_9BACL|nr:transposase [Paenactinomyces guangxiensis]